MRGFDRDFQPADPAVAEELFSQSQGKSIVPVGASNITMAGGFVTAQKVAVERDETKILGKLKILAQAAGTDYFYAWTTKNKDGTKGEVSGPTIKLANDVVRVYGNCVIGADVRENDTHLIFAARITDLESGTSMTRLFQQRKSQDTGMKDRERQADITFQIGQSKAIRNVVANFLSTFADFALEEARKSLVERFGKDLPGSREWIAGKIENMKIELALVEKHVGRVLAEWTAKDIAKVIGTLTAIHEGMTTVDDVFPSGATPSAVGEAAAKAPAPPPPKAETAEAKQPAPDANTEQEKASPAKGKKSAPAPSSEKSSTPAPSSTSSPQTSAAPTPEPTSAPSPSPASPPPPPTEEQQPLVDDSDLDEKSAKLKAELLGQIGDMPELIKAKKLDAGAAVDGLIDLIKKKDERVAALSPDDWKAVKSAASAMLETLM